MALVNRKSDLTTLKYGRDRRGGGDSGQPYITRNIPERLRSINFANSFLGNDFLIRGGVTSVGAVLRDGLRLTKFLTSLKSPNGLLFTAKQNLLARQNPVTGAQPDRLYLPYTTLAQAVVNPIGLHLMKDGKKLRIDDNDKYFKLTKNSYNNNELGANNTNKLLLLYETKLLTPTAGPSLINNAVADEIRSIENFSIAGAKALIKSALNTGQATNNANALNSNLSTFGIASDSRDILFSYIGGPNAPLGGKSKIRRVFDTTEGFRRNLDLPANSPDKILTFGPDLLSKRSKTRSTGFGTDGIRNFEKSLTSKDTNGNVGTQRRKELIGDPASYIDFNRSTTYGEGDPGKRGRDRSVYYTTNLRNNSLTGEELENTYQYDKVNAYPLYSSTEIREDVPSDIVKFNIGVLNLDNPEETTWIHLRAYLKNFTDGYNADWQGFKYMGRGNEFYKYNGFRRNINMSFEAVVHSRYEQAFVYDKLNFLASSLAPNYSTGGYMRGNIVKLTVGDYLNNVQGILTSINYNISDDTTWDIARNQNGSKDKNSLELPMKVSVDNFQFTPIHDFLDRSVPNSYPGQDNPPTERYISLDNGYGYKATKPIPSRLNSIPPTQIENRIPTPSLQLG